MKHRSVSGRIAYTSRKPGMEGRSRGFETFLFTHHADGKAVMRAHCEIEEPEPTVMRDVVYAMDADRQPMDMTVRLVVGDEFMGSGWFRFDGEYVECESYGPSIGRHSEKIAAELPVAGFGTHPIVSDGYMLSAVEQRMGVWRQGEQRTLNCYLPSPDHRGATAPKIAQVKIGAKFIGCETVTVAAGTFAARHFQFLDDGDSGLDGEHPTYDMWITDDDDAIFLQGGVGGYMMTWYELAELTRD